MSFREAVAGSLTTDADDVVFGTAGDDVGTVTNLTLQTGDRVLDQVTTDNDTLNLTVSAAAYAEQAEVLNVENINVDLNVFAGGQVDATNFEGATITGSSAKLGFDGEFKVLIANDNNVTAGNNVTDLIVTGLDDGVVDAGAADTVDILTEQVDEEASYALTVNGDIELVDMEFDTAAAADEVTLNVTATEASVVDVTAVTITTPLTSADQVTIAGFGDVSLKIDGDTISGAVVTGFDNVNLDVAGTSVDVSNWDVDAVEVSTTATVVIKDATGQVVNVTKADADVAVDGDAAGVTTDETVTVNVSADQAAGTNLAITDFDTVALNLTDSVEEVAALDIEGDATVTVAGDVTFADVSKTAATDTIAIAGTGDVTVTDADDFASINSSALTGDLDLTLTVDADVEVIAGSGDDDITLAQTTNVAAVTLGAGANMLDATSIAAGTLAVTGGAGVDTVKLNIAAADTSIIAMDGAAGADVVNLTSTNDLTDLTTWAVDGFTSLTLTDASSVGVVALSATAFASQLAGFTSLSITGPATGVSNDTLVLTVEADEATTDLSGLVVADTASTSVVITGQATADAITGTNAADTITTGGGADTVYLSAGGADEVTILSGESASTAMVSIEGFNTSDATSQADVLTSMATILADTAVNGAVDVVAAITDGDGTEDVTVAIDANGIATLDGDDAGLIDTLAEWVAVMSTDGVLTQDNTTLEAGNYAAFEFDGNTYVVSQSDAVGAWSATAPVTDIVELTGVTDVAALAATAGLNTVVIA